MSCKLFVANLPSTVTGADLQRVFAPFGVVKWADVAIDTTTSKSKGFGFVQMACPREAGRAAVALSGRPLQGKKLIVRESTKSSATARAPIIPVSNSPDRPRRTLVTGRHHHRSPRRG